jgi:hypothetical protein
MAINSLLAEKVFAPEDAARLVAAYQRALDQLHLKGPNEAITELIARKIY